MRLSAYWESLFHNLHERQGDQIAKTKQKKMDALVWSRGAV